MINLVFNAVSDEVTIVGPPGPGVPLGGTTGQVLAKASNANLDTYWITPTGFGGGGGATSFTTLVDPNGGVWEITINTAGQLITTLLTSIGFADFYGDTY